MSRGLRLDWRSSPAKGAPHAAARTTASRGRSRSVEEKILSLYLREPLRLWFTDRLAGATRSLSGNESGESTHRESRKPIVNRTCCSGDTGLTVASTQGKDGNGHAVAIRHRDEPNVVCNAIKRTGLILDERAHREEGTDAAGSGLAAPHQFEQHGAAFRLQHVAAINAGLKDLLSKKW